MKELKFRAWDKRNERYVTQKDAPVVLYDTGETAVRYGNPCNGDVELLYTDNYDIEQYTGLKDKNGKEIYEGDILKFRGRFYGVKFDTYGQFYMENKNYHWLENWYSFRSVDIWCADGILVEVVGNIHENLELIEKEKE